MPAETQVLDHVKLQEFFDKAVNDMGAAIHGIVEESMPPVEKTQASLQALRAVKRFQNSSRVADCRLSIARVCDSMGD